MSNKKHSEITITWKAFGSFDDRVVSSISFVITREIADHVGIETYIEPEKHESFCELVFHDTNLYDGRLWLFVEPKLETQAPKRTHTALSVGDEIEIDGSIYRCERVGFAKVETAVAQ